MFTTEACLKVILTALALFLLTGCGVGKDKVIFVTKTSLGVDVDSKPPALDIGYARTEGTVAPVSKDGTILPQMASFDSEVGIVNQAVGQSFATGNAAEIMSKFLASTERPSTNGIDSYVSKAPTTIRVDKEVDNRKPYLFATKTEFALRVNFPIEQAGIPDSLSLGYKRKELAVIPLISISKGSNKNEVNVGLPSLLTTVSIDNKVQSTASSSMQLTQFFATGPAATHLSALPEIRSQIAPRLMPDSEDAAESVKNELRDKRFTNKVRLNRNRIINDRITQLSDDQAFAMAKKPPVTPDENTKKLIERIDGTCKRLKDRDCNGDGTPDSTEGQPNAEASRAFLKAIAMENKDPSNTELNAWETALGISR